MYFILIVLFTASPLAGADPVSKSSQKKTSKMKKTQPRPQDACEWSIQCGPGEMCKIPDRKRVGVCVDDPNSSTQ